jgi:DNA-binding transcriptional regulator YiaG
MERAPMTVIETEEFVLAAERLMTEVKRAELVMFVATNPDAGDIIPETGGVRKLRWALEGRGKLGGARVIYYYHSEGLPAVMLDMYAKNVKANLNEGRAKCNEEEDPGIDSDAAAKEDQVKKTGTKTEKTARSRRRLTPGERIIRGLDQAIAWARGEDVPVRVTTVEVPTIDVRAVRRGLKLSQAQFAARFGVPPATLRNWEQGRTRPDGPARVLLAVIAKHPEAVEDVLRKAS